MTLSGLYAHSHPDHPPLRIAVILDARGTAACHAAVLNDVNGCEFARIVAVLAPPRDPHVTLPDPEEESIADSDPASRVDVSALLRGVPEVQFSPDASLADAISKIREHEVDVVLCFTPVEEELAAASRHGLLAYDYGAGPGADEAYALPMADDACYSVSASLKAFAPQDQQWLTLCRGYFPLRSRISTQRTRFGPMWGSRFYVLWKLNELHRHGWDFVRMRAVNDAAPSHKPASVRRARASQAFNILRGVVSRAFSPALKVQDWYIGLRTGGVPLADAGDRGTIEGIEWIENPKGRFYADPCLFRHRGEDWLFFEDYDFDTGFAVLSAVPVASAGSRDHVVPVLNLGSHLSYPMVFEHDGEVFLMPESSALGSVRLFRSVRFPHEWKLEKVLFEGLPLVDTTPLLHEGLWYFFTAAEEPYGNVNAGLLFTATSLTGTWKLHPASPESLDIRTCRSAGPIVREGSRIIRATQDCMKRYGYGFQLSEIATLNEREIVQRPLASYDPSRLPGFLGTHTYHRLGNVEVIDGVQYLRRQAALAGARRPASGGK